MTPPRWAEFLATGEGTLLVWGSLGLAIILVWLRGLTSGSPLAARLGPVNWNFTDSWATTLTAVGALLGTILAAADVLPTESTPSGEQVTTTSVLSPTAFAGLNLLFGLLILVAPLLFRATAGVPSGPPPAGTEPPFYQGYVGFFLLSATITAWAVIGELLTVTLLLQDVASSGALGGSLSGLFAGFLLVALILVGVYVWRAIQQTLSAPNAPVPPGAVAVAPRWSLL